jgi:hypothetical protein
MVICQKEFFAGRRVECQRKFSFRAEHVKCRPKIAQEFAASPARAVADRFAVFCGEKTRAVLFVAVCEEAPTLVRGSSKDLAL